MKLAAATDLRLAVDEDVLGSQERLDVSTSVHHAGELEELAEADHLASDRDLLRHGFSLAAAGEPPPPNSVTSRT